MNRSLSLFQKIPALAISAAISVIALLGLTMYELSGWQDTMERPVSMPTETKTIHLRLGHNTPETTALHQAAVRFAKAIEAESHGQLKIDIFPAQQLGSDHKMIEMTRNGELDILLVPTAKLSIPIPAMQYVDLPFLFPSREDAYQLLDGEPGRLLLEKLNRIGLLGVTFWENGFKHFTGNQFYTEPDDFIDKKFRIMKSRLLESQFNALGAEAIPIDFHSTYQALKDGVVDGQENPLVAIASMGFHKVQSHLTLSDHAYLGYAFTFSKKTFAPLPQSLKTLLIKTAQNLTQWERAETQRREAQFLTEIKQAGVKTIQLTELQRQQFAQKTAHLIQDYEPIIGSDIISYTQTYLRLKYDLSGEAPTKIAIGLDADLSSESKKAGLAIKRGIELALADINAKGGLLGKEIILLPMDHRILASKGIENLKQLASHPRVIAVVGGKQSAVIMAEKPLIHQLNIPYLIPWASASQITVPVSDNPTLFRLSINDDIGAQKLTDFASRHYQRPAILVENSIWGRSNLERYKSQLAQMGTEIAMEMTFNRGQESFNALPQLLKESHADSIILVAPSNEAVQLVKTLDSAQTLLPIISHWGITGGNFFAQIQPIIPKLDLHLLQTFSFGDPHNGPRHALHLKYVKTYQKINAPYAANGVAQAYDLVHLFALAVETAQSLDRQKVIEALENLPPYQGALKTYSKAFSPNRHDALTAEDIYIAKLMPDGSLKKVGLKGQ